MPESIKKNKLLILAFKTEFFNLFVLLRPWYQYYKTEGSSGKFFEE